MDTIEQLVNEAYTIFGLTSVFEVIDRDDQEARDFLNRTYINPPADEVDKYLALIAQLRPYVSSKKHKKSQVKKSLLTFRNESADWRPFSKKRSSYLFGANINAFMCLAGY